MIEIFNKLRKIVQMLFLKWKLIVTTGLIGGILGLLLAFVVKPSYEATLIFTIDSSSKSGALSGLLNFASQIGGTGGVNGDDSFSQDNLVEILKTRNMITKALLMPASVNGKKDLLANHYIEINELREDWSEDRRLKDFRFKNTDQHKLTYIEDSLSGDFYNRIAEKMSVDKFGKMTSLISIIYNSNNEEFSKAFTESLVKAMSDYYVDFKTEKVKSSLVVIQNRSDSIQRALINAEYALARWKDTKKMIVKMQGNVEEANLIRNVTILELMYGEVVKQLELTRFTLLTQTPLVQVIDGPVLPLKKKKIGKIKGLLLGGILAGFFCCLFLIGKKFLGDFLKELDSAKE
jgi:uncharacterized protein involved in exopolysaccharide biosynthesis